MNSRMSNFRLSPVTLAVVTAIGFDGEDDPTAQLTAANEALAAAKAKVTELETTSAATASELKALRDTWGDMDAKKVKALMDKLGADEELQLIADGKVEEVIERRTAAVTSTMQSQIDAATNARDEAQAGRDDATEKLNRLIVSHAVRSGATEQKVVGSAIEDVLARAASVFKVNEEGAVVPVDNSFGKDGKTPLSPGEWVDGMREKAPHWFPQAQGAGARGGGGGAGSGFHTITRTNARDMQKYRSAKAAAEKAGVELRIVADMA